jgi:hypothetical protein
MDDTLALDAAAATTAVTVYSDALVWGLTLAAVLSFVAVVVASVWLVGRVGGGERRPPAIREWPPVVRLLAALVFLCLLFVQAVAAAGVWVQTRIVHESAVAYFQAISYPRLVGTSHAHLFGYAVTYGLIGFFVAASDAGERTKAILVATLLWGGVFDVLSWWGIKVLGAPFEWLSLLTGLSTAGVSLVGCALVGRDLLRA